MHGSLDGFTIYFLRSSSFHHLLSFDLPGRWQSILDARYLPAATRSAWSIDGEAEPGRISTWLAIRMKFNIGFMGARLSPIVMVKRGPLVTLEEGANVEYIREYTSIPVPKLHCAFTRKGCTYIVTEYIHGQTIWEYWQRASEKSKEIIRRQLISLMHDLRSVPNPVPGQLDKHLG